MTCWMCKPSTIEGDVGLSSQIERMELILAFGVHTHKSGRHRPIGRALTIVAADRFNLAEATLTAQRAFGIPRIVDIKPGRIAEVKADGAFIAEDLKAHIVSSAGAHARYLDCAQRAIQQASLQQSDIIDINQLSFSGATSDRTLLDSRCRVWR